MAVGQQGGATSKSLTTLHLKNKIAHQQCARWHCLRILSAESYLSLLGNCVLMQSLQLPEVGGI